MNSPQSPLVTGARVIGGAGESLGHVRAVYVDATGAAAWAAIQCTDHSALVPLQHSRFDGTTLQVPYDAARLQTAPHHDPNTLISHPAGDDLACHYGLLPAASADGAPPVAVGSEIDRHLTAVTMKHGTAAARTVPSVLQRKSPVETIGLMRRPRPGLGS
jgi:hypothetical protein